MVLIDCFSSGVYVCHRESRIFQGPHFVKRLVYLPAMKPSFSLCFSVGNHFRVRVEHANYNWCQTMMMKRLILFSMVFIFLPSIYAMVKTLAIGYIVMNLKEDGHPHVYGVNIPIITMPIL